MKKLLNYIYNNNTIYRIGIVVCCLFVAFVAYGIYVQCPDVAVGKACFN